MENSLKHRTDAMQPVTPYAILSKSSCQSLYTFNKGQVEATTKTEAEMCEAVITYDTVLHASPLYSDIPYKLPTFTDFLQT